MTARRPFLVPSVPLAVANSLVSNSGAGNGLTSGIQEPAIVNQATTLTLATLESVDATPSDFTAQIDWGDGSGVTPATPSADENGLYQITGTHSYAADGSYTATITVSDNSGGSASTTSTVNVGDLYAGIPATLKLGAFTAADPSTTYTATVAWGDGSSSNATVTESSGAVTIVGTHAFAAAGSYGAQITITSSNGGQIIANAPTVQVVAAPITMYTTDVGIAPSDDSGNVVLAIFTDPNTADTAANFNSNISVGGGAPSNGTITGFGGMFAVTLLPALLGMVPCTPEIQLDENEQPVAAAQPAVQAMQGGNQLSGPAIVPGNSTYQFGVTIPFYGIRGSFVAWLSLESGSNAPEDVPSTTAISLGGMVGGAGAMGLAPLGGGVAVDFFNVPAMVYVHAKVDTNAGWVYWETAVAIVQVSVAGGNNLSYSGNSGPNSGPTDMPAGMGLNLGGVATKGVLSAPIPNAASWSAAVTLTGPGNNIGVSQIKVGFIQHIYMQSYNGQYANVPAGQNTRQQSNLQGQTLLDMRTDSGGIPQPALSTFVFRL